MTISTLDKLFRKAVIAKKGGRCEICGQTHGPVEVHHIIARWWDQTRWDIRNGFITGHSCHHWAHDRGYVKGLLGMLPQEDREELEANRGCPWPDFLAARGQSREEFQDEMGNKLKEIIKKYG